MSTAPTHPIHPANAFNVARADRSTLFELGAERKWARHQTLFTAGKPVASVHRVVSGMLARSIALSKGRRQIVDILLPGDTCGFFQSGGGHLFDCEAITEATTCAIDASHLRKLRIGCPDVGKAIDEELVCAAKRMAEHLVTVGKLSATERLLHFLHWLEAAYSERGLPTHPIALPMSRSDIGDYLGMQVETVSRAFASLKKRDLVGLLSAEQVVLRRRPGSGPRRLGEALGASEMA